MGWGAPAGHSLWGHRAGTRALGDRQPLLLCSQAQRELFVKALGKHQLLVIQTAGLLGNRRRLGA